MKKYLGAGLLIVQLLCAVAAIAAPWCNFEGLDDTLASINIWDDWWVESSKIFELFGSEDLLNYVYVIRVLLALCVLFTGMSLVAELLVGGNCWNGTSWSKLQVVLQVGCTMASLAAVLLWWSQFPSGTVKVLGVKTLSLEYGGGFYLEIVLFALSLCMVFFHTRPTSNYHALLLS